MAVVPSIFGVAPQFVDTAGEPAVGDKLFFYVAGSNTKQNTYTDSTGMTANPNPIILNALGMPPNEIWWTDGSLYKMVWAPSTDTDPPTSPIRTFDNLSGINDSAGGGSGSQSEWVIYPSAPTYINATSFSVVGDQTALFNPKRRVRTVNSGGTIYSTIGSAVFGAVTTVTVVNDSGVLDAGLSQVSYGLLSAVNPSMPEIYAKPGANADITSLSGLTSPIPRANTLSIIQSLPDPTLAANAMTLPASTHALDFRSATLTTGIPTTVTGTAAALVIPASATLGTINAVQSTIVEVIMNNGGTLEKAVVNLAGGNDLSEEGVISTTAISAAATSANIFYSTTARSNLPYRVVRKIVSTQATAGTWVTSPSLIQGQGGNALAAMSSLGYGQTWQSVARSVGTTYYNTTNKPLHLVALSGAAAWTVTIKGSVLYTPVTSGVYVSLVIPPGNSYMLTVGTISNWLELR